MFEFLIKNLSPRAIEVHALSNVRIYCPALARFFQNAKKKRQIKSPFCAQAQPKYQRISYLATDDVMTSQIPTKNSKAKQNSDVKKCNKNSCSRSFTFPQLMHSTSQILSQKTSTTNKTAQKCQKNLLRHHS